MAVSCEIQILMCTVYISVIIAVFHTTGLLSLPQTEIRAGKLLVDPGHRPVVDRALQKNTHIADDHGKKLPKTIVSLK
jgi:hypothetical protein